MSHKLFLISKWQRSHVSCSFYSGSHCPMGQRRYENSKCGSLFHKLLYLVNSKGLMYIMSKHNTHIWRASVHRRVHSILQQQWHQARAFLSLQPRVQRAGRGRSEEQEISGREMQRRMESLGEAITAWRNLTRNNGTTPQSYSIVESSGKIFPCCQ